MRHREIEITRSMERNIHNNNASSVQNAKRRWFCWLAVWFIAAQCVMFILVFVKFLINCPNPTLFGIFFGVCSSELERLGALDWNKVVHQHQGWRLITSIWLYGGYVHGKTSLFSLGIVGKPLEQQCGSVRFGIIYLLSGLSGTIITSLFVQQSVSVGASGALFGLFGAQLSIIFKNWPNYPKEEECGMGSLLVVLVINVAVGIQPHVGNFSHIGGFITGCLLVFVLLPPTQPGQLESQNPSDDVRVNYKYNGFQNVHRLASLILLVAWFIIGLVLVFRGVNAYEHCHWCHYLGCVPTGLWKCDQ